MFSELRESYKALDRPLTVCGVDRRLFFLALLIGAAAFNLFYSLLAGCLLGGVLYAFAWWSTSHDPQMLQILLRAGAARVRKCSAASRLRSRRSPLRGRDAPCALPLKANIGAAADLSSHLASLRRRPR